MQAIANAIEQFRYRTGSLPSDLSTLFEHNPVDPWGTDYDYSSDGRNYRVTSFGADGRLGGEGENADFGIESGERSDRLPNKPLQPTRAAEPIGQRAPPQSGPRG